VQIYDRDQYNFSKKPGLIVKCGSNLAPHFYWRFRMFPKTRIHRLLLVFSIGFGALACNLFNGGTITPTATFVPTDIPPENQPPPTVIPTEVPEELAITKVPTESPEALPLFISQVSGYFDEFGDYRVIGLVTNNTERTYDNLEIEINIYDAAGEILYTEITNTTLYTLPPDQTSPFGLWVYDDLVGADHVEAEIVGKSVGTLERALVEIRGVLLTVDDASDVHLTGEIYNANLDPIQINDLAGATFEAEGNLLTADSSTVLGRYLDPGEKSPFRITMTSPVNGIANIADYEIYINAEIAQPEDFFDLVISDEHNFYVDTFGFFHLVGEITNDSTENLDIELVAGLYDEADSVLDAASTGLAIYAVAPGETLPYDFAYWGPVTYKDGILNSVNSYSVQWDPYWTWTSSTEYVSILVQASPPVYDENYGIFSGEVLNDSGTTLNGATIILSLYDHTTGELIATDYDVVFDEILAGANADFEIYLDRSPEWEVENLDMVVVAKGELP